ncbi:MAG: DUF3306 domain-containing protein [Clostridia bacterium]
MSADKETFLGRWSRLKREEERKPPEPAAEAKDAKEAAAPALPPVDKLTPQSDFAPFMHPRVQDSLRRVALKKLFGDPHFNVPDAFEPFSGDWTGAEPIGAEALKKLNQARSALFSKEEREAFDREELERDHEEALALDAEWSKERAEQAEERTADEPGSKNA